MKEKKIKLLDINMLTSIIFIFTVIISIILTYNEKLILLGEKPLFDKDDTKIITTTNRFVLLIIAVIYIYTSYHEYKINQILNKENEAKSSFVHLIIHEIQLITVIVVFVLPFIFPADETGESNIIVP